MAVSRLSHLVPHYSPALYRSSEKRQQAFTLDEDRKREGRQQPGQVNKTGEGKRREEEKQEQSFYIHESLLKEILQLKPL